MHDFTSDIFLKEQTGTYEVWAWRYRANGQQESGLVGSHAEAKIQIAYRVKRDTPKQKTKTSRRKTKFVAIMLDGDLTIHALHANGSNYATLCMLDGDDPEIGQEPAEVPENAKINCQQCIAIITTARKYSARDIES